MADIEPEINALAFIVHNIRPSWPRPLIETALADDHRDLGTLTRAAIQAAQTPATRHPNGIRTTFPGADGCSVCEQRERSANTQPPPITRCETCGRINSEHHNCKPLKPSPDWHNRRRQLATKYTHLIRNAQDAGDWNTAAYLKAEWQHELNSDRDSYRVDILYTPDGAK